MNLQATFVPKRARIDRMYLSSEYVWGFALWEPASTAALEETKWINYDRMGQIMPNLAVLVP